MRECFNFNFTFYFFYRRAGEDESKKWGMLGLVNQLVRIYFRIKCLNLCRPLIRAVDQFTLKDKFPLAHRVTYMYYVGRKAMFDSDYELGKTN